MSSRTDRFEVRLARTDAEIASAQRLRYRVFVEEMGAAAAGADHAARLECDAFDPHFDHLILLDNQRKVDDPLDEVIGVYRVMPSERALAGPGFYGASEYDLSPLIRSGRKLVELGRSCVLSEYRGGHALQQLWNGLAHYVLERQIEVLFGVASFAGTSPERLAQALSYLHYNHLAPEDMRVRAIGDAATRMDRLPPEEVTRVAAMQDVPPLIKAYLRVGGFVGEGAYIDRDFNTLDVCLLMDTERMSSRYRDQYLSQHADHAA